MALEETASVILALGGLLPLLTAALEQPGWSARTRTWVSVAVSVLAGLVAYVTQNGLDFSSPSLIVTFLVGVTLASATSYKTLWKPSGVADKIENATSRSVGTPESEVNPEEA